MSLTLFIFIGLFGVFFITFIKRPLINLFGENNILLFKLKNAGWFQNFWLAGIFLIGSIFLWIIINKAWQGTRKNRLKMGAVGSSFYMILSLMLIYLLVTLEPSYPGEDTFMRAIGLVMGIVVTTVAFISCLIFTGFSIKKD